MAAKAEKQSKSARAQRSESESSSSAESSHKAEESSAASSEEDESSNSASESDSESVASEKATETLNGKSEIKTSQARTIRPPQPYKPPSGFKSAKNQSSTLASSSLSNLQGKQVFHITAPAYLPLSKIKEISLASALKGETIIEHQGTRYGIPVDSLKHAAGSGQTLFLYDEKANKYRSSTANVPTYHIQETIELLGGPEYEETTVRAAEALINPPRKQPKNLKMRFRPVGSGDGQPQTLGSSDGESDGEQPTLKVPAGAEKEKERKRKHPSTEGDAIQSAGLPRKKSKKHPVDSADNTVEEKAKKSKDRDGKKRKKTEKA